MTDLDIITEHDIPSLKVYMPNDFLEDLVHKPVIIHKLFAFTIAVHMTIRDDAIPMKMLKEYLDARKKHIRSLRELTMSVDGKMIRIYSLLEVKKGILWFTFTDEALGYIDPVAALERKLSEAGYKVRIEPSDEQ